MEFKNQIPPFLKAGDTVGILSPSFAVEDSVIANGIALLREWGLNVKTGPNALTTYGPFAGTDEQRLSDIQEFTSDPEIKAIFCSRGGYGMMRIIDKIDFSPLRKFPKWYVGFSDITVLHIWLCEKFNTASVHGDMMLNCKNPDKSKATFISLKNSLFGNWEPVEWESSTVRPGKIQGEMTGGNLSLIHAMCAARAPFRTGGKILFIEEVGEQLYHLDRMMVSLRKGGWLDDLAALVAGGFSRMEDTKRPWGVKPEEIIMDAVSDFDYPVLFNFPAGHIADNRAFYIGREAEISLIGKKAVLSYL